MAFFTHRSIVPLEAVVPSSLATWDSGSATAGITISGAGLIVTCSGGGGATQARSVTSKSSGKWYVKFEFTNNAGGANTGVGLAVTGFTLGSVFLGGSTSPSNTVCAYKSGEWYHGGGNQGLWKAIAITTGAFLELAVDLDVSPRRIWWQGTGSTWNNAAGDPVAGTGGFDISAVAGDVYFACDFESGETGSVWTIVSGTPPSGYTQWT